MGGRDYLRLLSQLHNLTQGAGGKSSATVPPLAGWAPAASPGTASSVTPRSLRFVERAEEREGGCGSEVALVSAGVCRAAKTRLFFFERRKRFFFISWSCGKTVLTSATAAGSSVNNSGSFSMSMSESMAQLSLKYEVSHIFSKGNVISVGVFISSNASPYVPIEVIVLIGQYSNIVDKSGIGYSTLSRAKWSSRIGFPAAQSLAPNYTKWRQSSLVSKFYSQARG